MTERSGNTGHLPGFSAARRVYRALAVAEQTQTSLPQLQGYVLTSTLGRGGGGAVYLGHASGSDRDLAVKLLDRPLDETAAAQRAWRELDVLTQLRLTCTPRVHDYGVADGRMFIATEHIDGERLSEYCTSHGLDRRRKVELLAAVADALQSIHEHGVIHRDVKPDNVMVDTQGRPIIIDLGIASILSEDVADTLTVEGQPIGTPAYMSPEQARGEKGAVSTRSDVYSLGATACFILTRKTPHDVAAPLHEAVRRVAQEPARDPRLLDTSLPRPLAAILAKALAADPRDRYATAAEFGGDLRRWLRGEPIAWTRPSPWSRFHYWVTRNPVLAAGATVVIISLAAAVVLGSLAAANASVAAERQQIIDERAEYVAEVEAWHADVLAREERLQKRRRKQIDRVEAAIENRELFDASIILLNYAEEVRDEQLDDREALTQFITFLDDLIEAARTEERE